MSPAVKQEINKSIDYLIDQLALLGEDYEEAKEALIDLKLQINEPVPIQNVSENIQQTLNVVTAQNIIDNEKDNKD